VIAPASRSRHETDVITPGCVQAAAQNVHHAFDRDDIHRLITRMDDVMVHIERRRSPSRSDSA
jgi:uncharacterized protein Yka (UPF0111/DUF47 family)